MWFQLFSAGKSTLCGLRRVSLGLLFTLAVLSGNTPLAHGVALKANGKGPLMKADAFSFLEDEHSDRTRAWIREHNENTTAELEGDPRFQHYYDVALRSADLTSPLGSANPGYDLRSLRFYGEWIYHLWTDSAHQRGVFRRARLASFLSGKAVWHNLIDIDALAAEEHRNWSFTSVSFAPNGRRCLVQLSDGGSYTYDWREFDLDRTEFVENGFRLPAQPRANATWRDDNTLLVMANFGPGTVNSGNMPLSIREWSRGHSLAEAREIFRGDIDDFAVSANWPDLDSGEVKEGKRRFVFFRWDRSQSFTWWLFERDGRLIRMTLPPRLMFLTLFSDYCVFRITDDWLVGGKTWKAGSLLSIPIAKVSQQVPDVELIMEPPTPDTEFVSWDKTRSGLLVHGRELGNARLWRAVHNSGRWLTDLVPMPDHGGIAPVTSSVYSNTVFVMYWSFLTPLTLYEIDVEHNRAAAFKQGAAQFDSSSQVADQLQARSSDGAMVPYFIVRPKDLRFDGTAPTLVYGYGAFGGSMMPQYSGILGRLWLERGGVYVVANVRGGQERGVQWWVKGTDRQHTYDDLIAVVEDLIRRKITAPKRIGVTGMSAGGLLAAVAINQRPDLFGAAVLKVPLVDQLRLDLGSGVPERWAREYGSLQDPGVREFIERTSPFQNLRRSRDFPLPLIITSATDQMVAPSQARRYAAKVESLGMPILFYETTEGGHGMATTVSQRARLDALEFMYLDRQLLTGGVRTSGN